MLDSCHLISLGKKKRGGGDFATHQQIKSLRHIVHGHKYSSPLIFYYIFHIKPHFFKKNILKLSLGRFLWNLFQDSQNSLNFICLSDSIIYIWDTKRLEKLLWQQLMKILKKSRALYSLMRSGLHGENGLDPATAISILRTYVIPIMFYGLKTLASRPTIWSIGKTI
jgi:hypothetical protein